MKLIPIVEGHGDYEAVPVLLRRLAVVAEARTEILRPIRSDHHVVDDTGIPKRQFLPAHLGLALISTGYLASFCPNSKEDG